MILLVFLLTAWLIFWVAHIALWRMAPRAQQMVMFAPLTVLGYGAALIVFHGTLPWPGHWWVTVPSYLCGIMLYIHWYIGMYRSLSIRILFELLASPQHTLTAEQLDQRYSLTGMFERRLQLMREHGWLQEQQGAYICLRPRTARTILWIRHLYRIERAG